MGSIGGSENTIFDVIIIGAGISGINAGYRIQSEFPDYNYTILESRNAVGGTWDLFRYPGIRSDSDLHTFGFPWRAWSHPKAIADGESIRSYIKDSAEEYGIDRKIRFDHKLMAGDWSSQEQKWILKVSSNGKEKEFTTRFIFLGTGYYDYDEPLKANIPGINNFKGQVIHPQFWPEDLNYSGKRIIIIGSGATAITLLPNLVEKATQVTMLQRSPGYILAVPAIDPTGNWMRKWLPAKWTYTILRWKFLLLPFIFFKICRTFPNLGRSVIRRNRKMYMPNTTGFEPEFEPSYNPWEQRLCASPDGDFFKALQNGNADIVTDTIAEVTSNSIQTNSGKTLETDIIITATGLKISLAGGAALSVDGKPVSVSEKYIWKGVMLQDMPNAAFVIGYTNASWTLGADITAKLVCRLLKHMDQNQLSSATPRLADGQKMVSEPMLNLSSTYIQKAKDSLPMAGNKNPWKARHTYLTDIWTVGWGKLTTGLQFTKSEKSA